MKRLKVVAEENSKNFPTLNEGCNDKFITEHRGLGLKTPFNDFRKYILKRFENSLKQIPGLYEQLSDLGGEPESAVRLYHDVWTNFMYDLDGGDHSSDLEENLEEYYMHDYLIDMKTKKLVY